MLMCAHANPQDRRQEGPAGLFRGNPDMRMGGQNWVDCIPFFVADFEPVRHLQKALTLASGNGYVNRT